MEKSNHLVLYIGSVIWTGTRATSRPARWNILERYRLTADTDNVQRDDYTKSCMKNEKNVTARAKYEYELKFLITIKT